MNRGYIKLWRAIFDTELYFSEPFTKAQAWIDLLLLANHKERIVFVRGIPVKIMPGQVLAGENFLSSRWQWSRNKTRRFMFHLSSKTIQQTIQQKTNICTLITLVNWKNYQSDNAENETPDDTTERQQKDIPKNVENVKNKRESKNFRKPTPEEVEEYAAKINFTLSGSQFCDFYESKGWKVGSTPMKDWQAAVRTWQKKRSESQPAGRLKVTSGTEKDYTL